MYVLRARSWRAPILMLLALTACAFPRKHRGETLSRGTFELSDHSGWMRATGSVTFERTGVLEGPTRHRLAFLADTISWLLSTRAPLRDGRFDVLAYEQFGIYPPEGGFIGLFAVGVPSDSGFIELSTVGDSTRGTFEVFFSRRWGSVVQSDRFRVAGRFSLRRR